MTAPHLPQQLLDAIDTVYQKCGMQLTEQPVREADPRGVEYEACRLQLDHRTVAFRVGKTTQTKAGHFVTCWRRCHGDRPAGYRHDIIPFTEADGIDFLVVDCSQDNHHGQFVFSRKVLLEQRIMGRELGEGKLSFRVYPPWVATTSVAALKTQGWQSQFFYHIAADGSFDCQRVRQLFGSCPLRVEAR